MGMKHFIVEITYTAPLETIATVVDRHRAFLKIGYDEGLLLFSGPQNPKTGGLVVARAESLEAIQAFFAKDPFATENVGSYRFIEFGPVRHQPWLTDWVEGK